MRRQRKDRKNQEKFSLIKIGRNANAGTLRASYTVEAAVVFSLTFFVMAALIIAAFYVHDRAVMQGMVCEMASSGSNFTTQNERSQTAAGKKKQMKESQFLGSRSLSGTVSSGTEEVIASWKSVYPVPGFAAKYLADNRLQIQSSWTSKVFQPSETIRKIRGIGEFLTGGEN